MPMICEAKGYGFKGRQPAGRCIVEGRNQSNKLTVWAQDLKAETVYGAYLLFAEKGRYAGIKIGALSVDEKGKGELRREFTSEDLYGFQLTDIAAIAVLAGGTTGAVSPLCGYRDAPFSWRHGFFEFAKPLPPATESKPPPIPQSEAPPAEEISESLVVEAPIEESKPPIAETPIEEPEPLIAEAPIDELKPLFPEAIIEEPKPLLTEATIADHEECPLVEPPAEGIIPPASEDNDETIHIDDSSQGETPHEAEHPPATDIVKSFPKLQPEPEEQAADHTISEPQSEGLPWSILSPKGEGEMANAFRKALDQLHADTVRRKAPPTPQATSLDDLFATRDKITPFKTQARKTTWISFTLQDPVPPPTNRPDLFNDPIIKKALEEHQHLILGKTVDKGPSWHIIGVPGVYDQASRQKAKRLGFTQFKCLNDAYPSWGEQGYWLMFVTESKG